MKNYLDKIENNLQSLFESSIKFFSGADYSRLVIHKLISAMEESVFTRPDDLLSAAHIYTIRVSPGMIEAWQSKQEVLDRLSSELLASASESGIVFSYSPVIRLAADASLKNDQIEISASSSQRAIGETSAITLNNGDDQLLDKARKQNAFLIKDGTKIIPINENPFNIGRRPGNHMILEDLRVSRSHAQIRSRLGKYILLDLNSMGGTFVNGQRVSQQELKLGDVISFAGVSIIFSEENHPDYQDTGGYTTTLDISQPSSEDIDK